LKGRVVDGKTETDTDKWQPTFYVTAHVTAISFVPPSDSPAAAVTPLVLSPKHRDTVWPTQLLYSAGDNFSAVQCSAFAVSSSGVGSLTLRDHDQIKRPYKFRSHAVPLPLSGYPQPSPSFHLACLLGGPPAPPFFNDLPSHPPLVQSGLVPPSGLIARDGSMRHWMSACV
jgi:hypothetical protein